jgi:hypothetical protein
MTSQGSRAWAGFTNGVEVVVILVASAIGLDAWADERATAAPRA